MHVRVEAVLARDGRAAGGRTGTLDGGQPERAAALEDVVQHPPEEAGRGSIGVSASPAAAPADDGADDEIAGRLVPVRGDAADDRRVLGEPGCVDLAVEQR